MKHSGQCPKCGSKEIIVGAKAVDRGDGNIQKDFIVATFRSPEALMFKGQQSSKVSAWVCEKCGYLEFYAQTPASLRIRKE